MTVKIMPLGDSITRGQTAGVATTDWEGYRLPLYRMLRAAGVDFDFVGGVQEGTSALPDRDHEGHGGDPLSTIAANIATYLVNNPPNVILLIGGTNDLNNGDSAEVAASRMATLLGTIYPIIPPCVVIVGVPPIMTTSANERWGRFRDLLPGVVAARRAAGQDVRLMQTASVGTQDGVGHPSLAGYSHLALLWLRELLAIQSIVPSGRWRGI